MAEPWCRVLLCTLRLEILQTNTLMTNRNLTGPGMNKRQSLQYAQEDPFTQSSLKVGCFQGCDPGVKAAHTCDCAETGMGTAHHSSPAAFPHDERCLCSSFLDKDRSVWGYRGPWASEPVSLACKHRLFHPQFLNDLEAYYLIISA